MIAIERVRGEEAEVKIGGGENERAGIASVCRRADINRLDWTREFDIERKMGLTKETCGTKGEQQGEQKGEQGTL